MFASFHLQLGNLPDWVGAIGTIAVFAVTAFVVIRDQGARREETATAAYDAALAVTVTVGPAGKYPRGEPPGEVVASVTTVPLLTITNSGKRTIYNVTADLTTRSGKSLGSPAWDEIPPNTWVPFEGIPDDEMWSTDTPMLEVFASATFNDVAKTRWYRDTGNKIHRVEPKDTPGDTA